MTEMQDLVVLIDVDNTLIDNDAVQADISAHLRDTYGAQAHDRYWALYEELRAERGYADYIGALERYRLERLHDPRLLRMATWLIDYPFASRLYPAALDVVRHAGRWGQTVVLSDGDAVFQPLKVDRSGIHAAFDGRVLIYVHKEQELEDVLRLHPARHYVMIDDKLRILTEMKRLWGTRLTTIFPRQGHYATDAAAIAQFPPPDVTVERIGDLLQHDFSAFLPQ